MSNVYGSRCFGEKRIHLYVTFAVHTIGPSLHIIVNTDVDRAFGVSMMLLALNTLCSACYLNLPTASIGIYLHTVYVYLHKLSIN